MTILELFLSINLVLVGVLVTYAVQHAYAHFKPTPKPVKKSEPLPVAMRARLVKQAEENFQGIVNRSALQLQNDLGKTGAKLKDLLDKFGSEVLDDEIKLYRADVEKIRESTAKILESSHTDIATKQADVMASLTKRQADFDAEFSKKQTELEAQLQDHMAAREQQILQQLDSRLQDAVMSFLTETLGHEVDLGAQTDYLLAQLEKNKDELIKGVRSGT